MQGNETAQIRFADATTQAGLTFKHAASPDKKYLVESMSGGVAMFDYDNDGYADIYFVNSLSVDIARAGGKTRSALYHNNGDGTFSDVTDKAGIGDVGWGMGAAVGDYNNDGFDDLYVTCLGPDHLFKNNGNGTFTDVTQAAGVSDPRWSTGAAFVDYDRDGKLDLFVANYTEYDLNHLPEFRKDRTCQYKGIAVQCGPRGMRGSGDSLFHNNGDGTFTEVSEKAGVSDPNGAYGWSSVFVDVDDDGWLDLLVANDSVPNFLYRNNHDGTFKDDSYISGLAVNADGRAQASMGIGIGDYNRDGKVDFHLTTFSADYKPLYRNDGDGEFSDVTAGARLLHPTIPFLGWGTGFVDFDNDGLLDIFSVNGHVYVQADGADWGTTWAQRPLLFRNLNGQQFEEVPPATGSGLAVVIPARGAAFGDLFNTGKIDVVINNIDREPTLLRNVVKNANHWITLKLVGGPKSPSDAIGAKVFVTSGGVRQRADIFSGGSYCSSSDPRVHFGLGSSNRIDKIDIHWPSGFIEQVPPPKVDRIVTVTEAKGPLVTYHANGF